ncbi:MAG: sn-glycerol-3-phosphate transport system permease protein UgpE [Chloroflexota bacterium]|nr:MAG: sn-glycerol-3-phosphate transport system permease protein UgpE [Chloroflexota bacterium]
MATTLEYTQSSEARALERRAWIRKVVFYTLDYGLMIFLALFFLFPIVVMVVSSVKPDDIITADMRSLNAFIPREFTTANFSCPDYQSLGSLCSPRPGENPGLFERLPFGKIFFNTIFVTTSIVVGGLLINSMAAYALARLDWPGRRIVLTIIIALIIIPFESIAVPLLLIVRELPWFTGPNWLNTYHVQIIPFMADAFSIFLFYQFFIGIPKDFDEAARVDGASGFTIYSRIIVPLSRPVFATVAILQFLAYWGAYLWPLMATASGGFDIQPLPVAMQVFFGQAPRQWGDVMAFASLATVPVLIVFLLFQKWFVQSVASAGVKG